MTDQVLLIIGCVVTFVTFAGGYIAVRSGFAHGFPAAARELNTNPLSKSAVIQIATDSAR